MSVPKRNYQKGFTLVELLVTISIFVILTGVVLFNQTKFNSTILLTNLAYDTALTVRQAQTYGINIKEFNNNGTGEFVPYGVYFETGVNNKSFILFADLTFDPLTRISEGIYGNYNPEVEVDSSICQSSKGCVNRYSIKRGNYIKYLCKGSVPVGQFACSAGDSISVLNIVFRRPNPDAIMKSVFSDTAFTVATIILGSSDNDSTRKVRVRSNGLIEIVN